MESSAPPPRQQKQQTAFTEQLYEDPAGQQNDDEREDDFPDGDEDDQQGPGDEEEDDEEEEEPTLKYNRVAGCLGVLLAQDAASSMAVHEKFLALGTHNGLVVVLDLNGNETRRYDRHSTTVSELSIDAAGEYLASCSMDGVVLVHSLTAPERDPPVLEVTSTRPVTALAVDPVYGRKGAGSRQVCLGNKGGQVTLCGKGLFGIRQRETAIHSGDGTIAALRWRGQFIAWTSDRATHIYDASCGQRIGTVPKLHGSSTAPALPSPSCLCWESDNTLVIALETSIRICRIKEASFSSGGGSALSVPGIGMGTVTAEGPQQQQRFVVEITHTMDVGYVICGVAPFEQSSLVVFTFGEDEELEDGQVQRERPSLRIITKAGEEVRDDPLPIRNYDRNRPIDCRLDYLPSEWLYYIVTPGDILIARPRDLDDHIAWLKERHRYQAAMQAAETEQARLSRAASSATPAAVAASAARLADLGQKYLAYLLVEKQDPVKAAELCPRVCGRDARMWEDWVMQFHRQRQLRAITQYVPVGNPTLSDTVYTLVLNQHLADDPALFRKTIASWPPSIYNTGSIIKAVNSKLEERGLRPEAARELRHALASLFEHKGDYGNAFDTYLKLGEGPVFAMIAEHGLFKEISGSLLRLFEFDRVEATKLLVSSVATIEPKVVVSQLSSRPELLLCYLDALFAKNPKDGAEYQRLMVELYATWDPSKLMNFLQTSSAIQLDDALRVCEKAKLHRETAFILEKMGNVKQALSLIMNEIKDVRMAITFVQNQKNDEELMEDLIAHSLSHPDFISGLLENIGSQLNASQLIQRIPNGQEIPGLRNHLIKILADTNLETSLREGCNSILRNDCLGLFDTLVTQQKRPVFVPLDTARCAACFAPFLKDKPEDVAAFWCPHVYHLACLKSYTHGPSSTEAPASSSSSSSEDVSQLRCVQCKSMGPRQKKSTTVTTAASRRHPVAEHR